MEPRNQMRMSRLLAVSASLVLLIGLAPAALAAPATDPALPDAATSGLLNSANVDGMHVLRTRGAAGPFGGGGSANLVYKGGSIQAVPEVYISWWGSAWNTGFTTGGYTSAQAQAYIRAFFTGVGGTAWNKVVTQYCSGISSGATSCSGNSATYITNPSGIYKGDWVDTTSVPSRPKQSDILNAAKRLKAQYPNAGAGATFFVFTPSGNSMSGFGTQWCAWHSSSGSLAYAYMPYIPDAGGTCGMNFVNRSNSAFGNGYFDGFSIVGGHEFSEAETDPFPSSGWVDSGGAENADKCAWSGSSTNISFGGNSFAIQPTWSNSSSGCATTY